MSNVTARYIVIKELLHSFCRIEPIDECPMPFCVGRYLGLNEDRSTTKKQKEPKVSPRRPPLPRSIHPLIMVTEAVPTSPARTKKAVSCFESVSIEQFQQIPDLNLTFVRDSHRSKHPWTRSIARTPTPTSTIPSTSFRKLPAPTVSSTKMVASISKWF